MLKYLTYPLKGPPSSNAMVNIMCDSSSSPTVAPVCIFLYIPGDTEFVYTALRAMSGVNGKLYITSILS